MPREPEVEIVNDLISACFEVAAENRAAAISSDDESRVVRLQQLADQLQKVARSMQRYVRQLGGEPEDENNLLRPERLRKAYQSAVAVLRGRTVSALQDGAREVLVKFREVLAKRELSPGLRQMIELHYQGLEQLSARVSAKVWRRAATAF